MFRAQDRVVFVDQAEQASADGEPQLMPLPSKELLELQHAPSLIGPDEVEDLFALEELPRLARGARELITIIRGQARAGGTKLGWVRVGQPPREEVTAGQVMQGQLP